MSSSFDQFLKNFSLDVRHDAGILPASQLPPPCPTSFIQVNFHVKFHVHYPTNQRGLCFVETIPLDRQILRDTAYLSNYLLLTKDWAEAYIYRLLDELGVPRDQHQPMADEFLSFVMGMAQDPDFANQSLLPIVLDIYVNFEQIYFDGVYREIWNIIEILTQERKYTKTSSIQALERVDSSLASMEECAICLEKFLPGRELHRLPCSHVYHQHCIVKWLLKSRFCPLCRFCID